MGTISYTHSPNATVWVIVDDGACLAVKEGVVIQVRGSALITGTTVLYDIRLDGESGTVEFEEADVFAALEGSGSPYVNGALDVYKTKLTA